MVQKYWQKVQTSAQGARTSQTIDRQKADRRQTDDRRNGSCHKANVTSFEERQTYANSWADVPAVPRTAHFRVTVFLCSST